MELRGVTAMVTGGASGLGAATVERLCAEGATVVAVDLDASAGSVLARRTGATFVQADVADAAQMEAVFAHLTGVRVLVCCAGIAFARSTVRRDGPHDLESFERVVRVNLTGTFNCVRLAAWAFSRQEPIGDDAERGVIITTASVAASDGIDCGVAYSASKAGVAGMTLALARDLGRHGIRVNSVAPGSFATPMVAALASDYGEQMQADTPFPPRFGDPSEFADLAAFLITNPMMNGETVRIDGAIRMRPSRLR